MDSVSVTSKGQVTIPKVIREALGIRPGSKVEFDLDAAGARLRLVRGSQSSSIEDGPALLSYRGPPIPVAELDGAVAMTRAIHARG